MNTMKRKIISLILAIATVISLIPTNIFVFSTDDAASAEYGDVLASFKEATAVVYADTTYEAEPKGADGTAFGDNGTFRIVEYYEASEIVRGYSESVRRYRIHSDDVPKQYAGYVWVDAADLKDIHQDDILEDTTLRGKQIHIVGHYESDGVLCANFYVDPMNELPLKEIWPWDLPENQTAIFTIGDVYKTPWGTWYYVTIEDEIYAEYNGEWVNATDTVFVEEDEEILIEGQVGITQGGEELTEITIARGQKEYVFTELDENLGKAVSYQWQILIDAENDRWANIYDGIYSYAVVSEALVCNILDDFGQATIRCIVTKGGLKYVSGELVVTLSDYEKTIEDEEDVPVLDTVAKDEAVTGSAFQITIEYQYLHETNTKLNNQTVAGTFSITLQPGNAYSGTVVYPPKVGYKTYVAGTEGDHDKVDGKDTYNGMYLKEETEYKFNAQNKLFERVVYYVPQEVNYTIKYFHQDLISDNYNYAGEDVVWGIADSFVGEVQEKAFEGFEALAYDDKALISANGTSVLEIYYDREYYLVDFDLSADDGSKGYGTMPYYVRYGTQINVTTPENPGYSFTGWKLQTMNDKDESALTAKEKERWDIYKLLSADISQIVVKDALKYKAKWDKKNVKYTIVYWKENVDNDDYSFWGYEVKEAQVGETVTWSEEDAPSTGDYSDIDCFTLNVHKSDKAIVVKGDGSSVINVYYLRKYYTLKFTASGDCGLSVHTHGDGTCDSQLICGLEEHMHTGECGQSTLTCTITEHQHNEDCCTYVHIHTKDCFENSRYIGNEYTGNRVNNVDTREISDGYIYIYRYSSSAKYVYIGGKWYNYSGNNVYTGYYLSTNASCPGEHVHGDGNCTCIQSPHSHIDSCYTYENCIAKTVHTHDGDCYGECTKIEHTHGNGCAVYGIKAKYQADIRSVFPNQKIGNVNYSGYMWTVPSGATSLVAGNEIASLDRMPGENLTFKYNSKSTACVIYYYVEVIRGSTYMKEATFNQEKKQFDLYKTVYLMNNVSLTYKEEFHPITGFTQWNSTPSFNNGNPRIEKENYMYYSRNQHNLIYYSNGVELKTVEDIYYQQSLAQYTYEDPSTPEDLEKDSVKFAGWYITPTCVGDPFDFANETMPDGNVMLYAKWEPTYWDVNVYLEKPTADAPNPTRLASFTKEGGNPIEFGSQISDSDMSEARNNAVDSDNNGTPDGVYASKIFNGWYYMENGVEKRFRFDTMTIKHDYEIYAKWTSDVLVPYTIYYKTTIGGQLVDVAKPEKGMALVGLTRTFEAKAGDKLYDEDDVSNTAKTNFQTGYFPKVRTDTLMMELDKSKNVLTFYYEAKNEIEYTVKHVFKSSEFETYLGTDTLTLNYTYTGLSTSQENSALIMVLFKTNITEDNIDNILESTKKTFSDDEKAELWTIISKLSPNAYQQEFILTTEEQNVVEFNWEIRTNSILYEIIIKHENITDDQYTTYLIYQDSGTASMQISYDIPKYVGFEFKNADYINVDKVSSDSSSTVKFELPASQSIDKAIQIVFYYIRDRYTYTVKYQADGKDIATSEEYKNVKHGTTVKEYAPALDDYYVVGATSYDFEIQKDTELVFTYLPLYIQFFYYAVPSEGGKADPITLYIKAAEYTKEGVRSTAQPYSGYIFSGWYTDENCLNPVDGTTATADGATITPEKPTFAHGETEFTVYYYAKFIPTSLTLDNSDDSTYHDDEQGFIYRIKGSDFATTKVDMRVTVIAGGKVTITHLPVGQYSITVENDWSWRYGDFTFNQDGKFDFSGTGTVTFNYSSPNPQWLSDNDYAEK